MYKMKTLIYSILVIAAISISANDLFSQSLIWKHINTSQSVGATIVENADGEYVFSIYNYFSDISRNTLLSIDGDSLGSSVICYCQYGIAFATKISDDRILNISESGRLLITDNSGVLLEELDQLGYNTTILKGSRSDSQLTLAGYTNEGGEVASTKHIIDLTSLEIVRESKYTGFGYTQGLDHFSDQTTIELYSLWNNSDSSRIVRRDANDSILMDVYINSERIVFVDITATDADEIFVIGRQNSVDDHFPTSGIVVKFSKEGEELWRKTFASASNSMYGVRLFSRIKQAPDGSLTIAGIDGIVESSQPLLLLNLSPDGNTNWEFLEQIHWDGETPQDFIYTSQNELIVVGTSGQTDYLGPERAYVVKISTLPSAVEYVSNSSFEIRPNPFENTFQVSPLNRSHKYQILDINGKIVDSGITDGEITLEGQSSGIYILLLDGFEPGKLVKL